MHFGSTSYHRHICYLIGSPVSMESGNLFACAPLTNKAILLLCRRRRPSECYENYKVWGMEVDFTHKIGCHGNVPCGIEKNNFRSCVDGLSSTNSANFVKIGQSGRCWDSWCDRNHESFFKQQQNISPPCLRFEHHGWANNTTTTTYNEDKTEPAGLTVSCSETWDWDLVIAKVDWFQIVVL